LSNVRSTAAYRSAASRITHARGTFLCRAISSRDSYNSEVKLTEARTAAPPAAVTIPLLLLIIDDLGMRKLPLTAAEELLEIIMRRYERASTLITSNRPVDDWGKLLGDSAAVTAMLDRLLHHGHLLQRGPRSWLTKTTSSEEKQ